MIIKTFNAPGGVQCTVGDANWRSGRKGLGVHALPAGAARPGRFPGGPSGLVFRNRVPNPGFPQRPPGTEGLGAEAVGCQVVARWWEGLGLTRCFHSPTLDCQQGFKVTAQGMQLPGP